MQALLARVVLAFALSLSAWFLPGLARAWVLQMPPKSEFVTLPQGRVVCGPAPEGFTVDGSRRKVRPKPDAPSGHTAITMFAQHSGACATEAVEPATLIVTGEHPSIDSSTVTVALDAGRLDLRGFGLEGVRVGWSAEGKSGSDVCVGVTKEKDHEYCALSIDKDLPADPRRMDLRWAPPYGRIAQDAVTYDRSGGALVGEQLQVPIARVLISRMFPEVPMVNVASREGRVMLVHPEAVSGVECGAVRCEMTPDGLLVGSVPAAAPSVTVRLRFLPRVFLQRGDGYEAWASERLTVLRCPMALVSGEPLRNVDELRVLLKLSPECTGDIHRLRFTANGDPTETLMVESEDDAVFVLLHVGRISSDRVSIVAAREDASVLAVVSSQTSELPPLMATMALPGYGEIDFIPRNRDAIVTITHVGGQGRLVPISVPGAYLVSRGPDGYHIRGVYGAGGYAALRFAYRIEGPPTPFQDVDFAQVTDPLQRPLKEASVPLPIGASSMSAHPIVELYCAREKGQLSFMEPGVSHHIPFDERDTCRLIIHRERIPREAGDQRIDIDVQVTAVGGEPRQDAKVTHHLVLRNGPDRDVIWLRGSKQQFDRFSVYVTHVVNESLYLTDRGPFLALPSSQWVVVTEDADFKFYATAAIPATLYRFSTDPEGLGSGPLSLNFGVLSRLTWLDSEGREGLVGLETGVMGMGLASDRDQLAIVLGLGIAIPLGNANTIAQAAINIHAWMAYSLGKNTAVRMDNMETITLSPWAFVFGPSITVGSVGAFL
ncbi:MAG TPA: hypothetical protein VJV78_09860 [Polyangiales bacterium]|nr:hypothetical protein [Polyangiales bacterium]